MCMCMRMCMWQQYHRYYTAYGRTASRKQQMVARSGWGRRYEMQATQRIDRNVEGQRSANAKNKQRNDRATVTVLEGCMYVCI